MSATLTFLDRLSLEDLDEMLVCADLLTAAGNVAKERGFEPSFTMSPGKPLSMRIDVTFLPHHAETPLSAPEMEDLLEQTRQSVGAAVAAAEQILAPVIEAIETHRDNSASPPVAEEPVAECPQAAATPPVSLPDAQHVGQADSTDQGNGLAAPWSAEEDAALIEAMAKARVKGLPLGATARRMSLQLGRTKGATEFRANNKLREAIHERVRNMAGVVVLKDDAEKDQAAEPANEEPGGEPGGLQQLIPAEKAPVQGVVETALQPATPEVRFGAPFNIPMEIWLHVEQVPRMAPFTLQVDRDLMRDICAGIPVHVIAGEFDMRPQAIEGRFDILTNRRNFKREKVLQVLDAMLATQINAKAAE